MRAKILALVSIAFALVASGCATPFITGPTAAQKQRVAIVSFGGASMVANLEAKGSSYGSGHGGGFASPLSLSKDRGTIQRIYKEAYNQVATGISDGSPYQVMTEDQMKASAAYQAFRAKMDRAYDDLMGGAPAGLTAAMSIALDGTPRLLFDHIDPGKDRKPLFGDPSPKGSAYEKTLQSAVAELCAAEKLDSVMDVKFVFGFGKPKSFRGFGTAAPGVRVYTWIATCKGELVVKAVTPRPYFANESRLPLVNRSVVPTDEFWDLVRSALGPAITDYTRQMKAAL